MPRVHNETAALIADLQTRIAQVVAAARQEGHDAALGAIRSLVGGVTTKGIEGGNSRRGRITTSGIEGLNSFVEMRRGPGRPRGSKNKPKSDATARPAKKRKSSWAGLTAEQRLARVNAIRKGKGLPPRSE
jgi:hypothetical protein